jgi:DNA helicase-2/ATP-dependent DNA helicase PcrA
MVARAYRRYQELLRRNQALDFDDLLNMTVQLFRQDQEVLERYQDRYRYILVDEFQDTNPAQYALVKLLGHKHRNLCAVGDPDQSIYGFRAADIRNVFNFERDFPELRIVKLEQNYRSTQTILNVAHAVISANRMRKEKNLWTENTQGEPVVVHEAYDERDEAMYAVRRIERHVANGGSYRDVAVMYRVNAQSRALEDAFVRAGLPYRLVGGTRFYERKEVKDVLAYVRLIQNPRDDVSLNRILNVPPRGIGAKTVSELSRLAKDWGVSLYEVVTQLVQEQPQDEPIRLSPLAPRARNALAAFIHLIDTLREERSHSTVFELLTHLLERTGYQRYLQDGSEEGNERWDNVLELCAKARDYDDLDPSIGLPSFLEEVSLVQAVDSLDTEQNAVTLITLHQAKGLEFPIVFIIGLEEGLCPHTRSMQDPSQMEEERRLFYVGVTRAMEQLYLVHASRRSLYGGESIQYPSSFLASIPQDLTDRAVRRVAKDAWLLESSAPAASRTPSDPYKREANPPVPNRASLGTGPSPLVAPGVATRHYHPGDRVFHPSFGNGIVVSSETSAGDEVVTVAFEGKGVKKLSMSFAPLQRA